MQTRSSEICLTFLACELDRGLAVLVLPLLWAAVSSTASSSWFAYKGKKVQNLLAVYIGSVDN